MVAERIKATVRTTAGAATGAAGAGVAVTCRGRSPVPAWCRDNAAERRRSRATAASPYGTRRAANDCPISGSAAAPRPCAWASRPSAIGDIDQDGGDDGGCASARRRVDVPCASGSERGHDRGSWTVAERIEATVRTTAGAATGAAGAGVAVTCRGRSPVPAWCRDNAAERRRSRATAASPYGTRRAANDRPISGSAAAPRPCAWASRPSAIGDIDQDGGDDGGCASARRRVDVPCASGSERGHDRGSWTVAERIEATVRTTAGAATGAAGAGAAVTLAGRRPVPHGGGTMRSSGGEAARWPRVRTARGGPRMIARTPGVRLPRVPARGRVDCSPLETPISTTETMADARQRDAEATCPSRAAASVVMIEEAGWWPRGSRPRCGRRRARRPAQPELAPP